MRSKQKKAGRRATIDAYLDLVPADKRAALEKLRRAIRAVVPEAEECISCDVPCFRFEGHDLVAFAAAAKHCSFYPGSATLVASMAAELERFDWSNGTIRFAAGDPLPAKLVRKIVKARIAEIRTIDFDE